MSLVGTRPILQDELRQYELHHRARIAIKPGITGMWQVSGRSDISAVILIITLIIINTEPHYMTQTDNLIYCGSVVNRRTKYRGINRERRNMMVVKISIRIVF